MFQEDRRQLMVPAFAAGECGFAKGDFSCTRSTLLPMTKVGNQT
jgi:hypothetical protein